MTNHTSEVPQDQFISIAKNSINITGRKFNRLTVLGPIAKARSRQIIWLCLCDCGNLSRVSGYELRKNHTKSCGCLQAENYKTVNKTHGMARTPIYNTWCHMIERCINPSDKAYKDYGARGISVATEWRNSFELFYSYVSKLPDFGRKKYTLDRINNDGNYAPGNVRWATYKTQRRNTRHTRKITFNGETKCITDWSLQLGLSRSALAVRLDKLKWTIEKAFTTPVRKSSRKAY